MSLAQIIGIRYLAEVGPLTFEMHYESEQQMTFRIIQGGGVAPEGQVETVAVTVAEIRPDVYLTSWKEESGATVTHLEDLDRGQLYSRITHPDGTTAALTGTIRPMD